MDSGSPRVPGSARRSGRSTGRFLEGVFGRYHGRRYVHPDPLEFLFAYPAPGDREIAGLVASCLAYGRVVQILRNVRAVLDRLGPGPREFLLHHSPESIRRTLGGLKHRFTTDEELACLLISARRLILAHGSLNVCFLDGLGAGDATVEAAMNRFVERLGCGNYLVPAPARGSACKRFCLFLRWMVRSDAVDPGGWTGVSPSQLVIPLDTHMARIARRLKLTRRRTADWKMAIDVTDAFRCFCPEDPVKYDFSLTRFGIRRDMDLEAELSRDARDSQSPDSTSAGEGGSS